MRNCVPVVCIDWCYEGPVWSLCSRWICRNLNSYFYSCKPFKTWLLVMSCKKSCVCMKLFSRLNIYFHIPVSSEDGISSESPPACCLRDHFSSLPVQKSLATNSATLKLQARNSANIERKRKEIIISLSIFTEQLKRQHLQYTLNYWPSWFKYTAQESSRVLCSPSLSPTFGSYLPLQAQAVFGSVNQFWGSWTVWLTALCSEAHQLWNGFFDGTAGCWNSKQRVINDVVVALAPGNLREELAASGI